MKVSIMKTGINGEGIGYIDRTPVFIPGALVDEVVDIDVTEKNKRYMHGKVNRIIKKSSDRKEPKCPMQHVCGGCPLMIVDYKKQLDYKYDILRQSLIKYAQVNPRLLEKVRPSEDSYGYRNQCKLPCAMEDGRLTTGMYIPNSNYFAEVENCIVHEKGLEKVRLQILKVLNAYRLKAYDYHQKAGIRSLILRGFDGKYQCTIVSGEHPLTKEVIDDLMQIEGMVSLWQSYNTVKKTPDIFGPKMIHLAGEKQLHITFDELQLAISPRSFFQLNTKQAKQLYRTIKELVPERNKLLVEAYSGIGAISLYVKDKAEEIIGIESIKDAVVNANANAKKNNAEHVSFLCADAADKLTYIAKNRSIDTLIVDPPRSGLDDEMLMCILKSKIKNIIYVSCNPATLGKNLAVLQDRYTVKKVIPLDMFPNTPHVETIVKLIRTK